MAAAIVLHILDSARVDALTLGSIFALGLALLHVTKVINVKLLDVFGVKLAVTEVGEALREANNSLDDAISKPDRTFSVRSDDEERALSRDEALVTSDLEQSEPNLTLVRLSLEVEKRLRGLLAAFGLDASGAVDRIYSRVAELNILSPEQVRSIRRIVSLGSAAARGERVESDVGSVVDREGPSLLDKLNALIYRAWIARFADDMESKDVSAKTQLGVGLAPLAAIQTDGGMIRFNREGSSVAILATAMGDEQPPPSSIFRYDLTDPSATPESAVDSVIQLLNVNIPAWRQAISKKSSAMPAADS